MNIERKCMICTHSTPDPAASVEARLLGKTPRMCLRMPPSVTIINSPQGLVGVNAYPMVNMDSISCGEFSMDNLGAPQ